jgi:lipopolysaccharide assembly outer membrane protein LptD (OstA)
MNKKIIQLSLFLLATLVLFVSMYLYKIGNVKKSSKTSKIEITKDKLSISKDMLTLMEDIKYISKDTYGNVFEINASTGKTDLKNDDIINMENVNAKIYLKDRDVIYITSDYAKYNRNTFETNFHRNVKLIYLDHKISGDNLLLFFQNNLISMSNNIIYNNQETKLEADRIELNISTKEIKILMYDKEEKIKILYKD